MKKKRFFVESLHSKNTDSVYDEELAKHLNKKKNDGFELISVQKVDNLDGDHYVIVWEK